VKIAPDGGDTVWDEVIKQGRNQRSRGSSWREKPQGGNVGMKQTGLLPLFNVCLQACLAAWEDIFCSRPLPERLLPLGASPFLTSLICSQQAAV
jgi:hypothetical protein